MRAYRSRDGNVRSTHGMIAGCALWVEIDTYRVRKSLGTASVGAIAVAEADPNVIYVGMGETTIRGNVAHGDGVYY